VRNLNSQLKDTENTDSVWKQGADGTISSYDKKTSSKEKVHNLYSRWILLEWADTEFDVSARLLAGIAGSNPAGSTDVCLSWVLCVVRKWAERRVDHSARAVLPSKWICV
jgi:hypothetical protein